MHFPACRLTPSIYIDGVTLVSININCNEPLAALQSSGRWHPLPPTQNQHFAAKLQSNLYFGVLPAKTASGRASWRPRQPPDGSSGAQDVLRTGLLALKTVLNGPLSAQDGLWTGLLAAKTALNRSLMGLLAPKTALNGSLVGQDGTWTSCLSTYLLF